MNRLLVLSLALLPFILPGAAVFADPTPPTVTAQAGALVDVVTGKVLWEKACHRKLPPASTTKIMTAIVALERGKLDGVVTASANAAQTPFTSLHLVRGERLTLHDLLYAMLMRSANDAAVTAAENVGGSVPEFVTLMNAKAKEIGANDTHFLNPHGLNAAGHYSSAYDLALMARYALRYPFFNDVVRTKTFRVNRSINQQDIAVTNHNHFLWRYAGADGIKTGYTREAGGCLVASATHGGWRLIAVVLNSRNTTIDSRAILDYGYKNFMQVVFARPDQPVSSVPVTGGISDTVALVPQDTFATVLRRTAPIQSHTDVALLKATAPVTRGEKLGTITGYIGDNKVGTADLVAANDVPATPVTTLLHYTGMLAKFSILTLAGYITYGTAVAKTARRRRRGFTKRS